LPEELRQLDTLTAFGSIYRYEDYDAPGTLDRPAAGRMARELRVWVEARLRDRRLQAGGAEAYTPQQ
jgi:hypothetical protein